MDTSEINILLTFFGILFFSSAIFSAIFGYLFKLPDKSVAIWASVKKCFQISILVGFVGILLNIVRIIPAGIISVILGGIIGILSPFLFLAAFLLPVFWEQKYLKEKFAPYPALLGGKLNAYIGVYNFLSVGASIAYFLSLMLFYFTIATF